MIAKMCTFLAGRDVVYKTDTFQEIVFLNKRVLKAWKEFLKHGNGKTTGIFLYMLKCFLTHDEPGICK